MKFLDLKDLSYEKLNEFTEIFRTHKELKDFLGGCPDEKYRAEHNCFYCDECWINAIDKVISLKMEEQYNKSTNNYLENVSKSKENGENGR